jgi:D-alanyl-D-alanine carboxypeptidase (penicillin-binding protein 5/6)
LKALLIPSGNDAAFVLATHHPLGYAGFTAAMNNVAQELHLDESHFSNPSGLDQQDQTASAHDLAILANEIMKDPVLRQIVGTPHTVISDTTGTIHHSLQSTHELLGVEDGVIGVKTGTTEFAGENLITAVNRDGHEVIIVVLGSQQRYGETKALIHWIFTKYGWESPSHTTDSR